MKIGYIFPGQGTQTVGMGKDIYEKFEEAREVYKKIEHVLGESIEDLTYNSSQEELNETKNTQITIYAMSMAILEVLKNAGIQPAVAAGLSLGEYTALTCAGVLGLEDGAKIVRTRGRLMQELAPEGDWLMAAVIGLEDDQVEKVCDQVKSGFVRAVNYNCPGQVVVSGERAAVQEAMGLAKEAGARKVVELKTSGPFHTEKLKEASQELEKELSKIEFHEGNIQVIKNFDGKAYEQGDDMVQILANHVINPVKFRKSIETMLEMGVDTFVEVGPGKTLSGFVKKVCKEKEIEAKILNIESVETLENALEILRNA